MRSQQEIELWNKVGRQMEETIPAKTSEVAKIIDQLARISAANLIATYADGLFNDSKNMELEAEVRSYLYEAYMNLHSMTVDLGGPEFLSEEEMEKM